MRYLFVIVGALSVFIACSDNSDEGLAEKVAGTYAGYSTATFSYSSDPVFTVEQQVVVTAISEEAVDVSYRDATWGSYKVEGAVITYQNGTYTVGGTGKVNLGMGGASQEYDYTLSAVLKDGQFSVRISLPGVMGGLNIVFTSGEAPYSAQIMGKYVGSSSAAFQYSPSPQEYTDDTLILTATSAGIRFAYENPDWGTYTVENMEVLLTEGMYTFTGKDSVEMGMGIYANHYLFTLEGKVNASTGKAAFVVKIPAVMGGITLTFSDGVKQGNSN